MEFVFCSTRKFTKINKTLILANVSSLEKVSLSLTLQFLIRMIFNILFGVGYPRFLDLLSVLKSQLIRINSLVNSHKFSYVTKFKNVLISEFLFLLTSPIGNTMAVAYSAVSVFHKPFLQSLRDTLHNTSNLNKEINVNNQNTIVKGDIC